MAKIGKKQLLTNKFRISVGTIGKKGKKSLKNNEKMG